MKIGLKINLVKITQGFKSDFLFLRKDKNGMNAVKSYFKDGTIIENLPNTMFRVDLGEERVILTTLKGSMRRKYVRLFPGDKVKVEMSDYDKERGRIVMKYR